MFFMQIRTLLTALLLAVSGLMGGCAEPTNHLDNDGLKTLLAQGVQVYDIRRAEEWRETGVIEGSRLLTFVDADGHTEPDFFPRFSAEAGQSQPVVLICRSGKRSDALARQLVEQMGYTQVYNVRHGITDWIKEGNPVVRKL